MRDRHEYTPDNDGACHLCSEHESHLVHVPVGKVIVAVDWSDGNYFFQRVTTQGPITHVVEESVVRLWEAVAVLDDVVAGQLRDLDNARYEQGGLRE